VTAPTILVVDDDEAGRFVKVQTLTRAGFRIIEASTGIDGWTMLLREHPDVVLLDVNLPDISGIEVVRRIREAQLPPPAMQILQISSTAVSVADRVRGLQEGADAYLTEPVDGAVLVATVRALLRVRQAESALAESLERERNARQMAEEANRLKDEFVATLSHELRTPLNALLGWIWQLRRTALEPGAQARALDSIERNATIQAQLINDLLDISRASKGKLQLQFRVLDLQAVVSAAVESVRDAIDRKQVALRLQLTPIVVAGDQARMQQVITNLLANAVQFTPAGGSITVVLTAEGGDAVLTVQDTGAGIEPAFLPYVFDQFSQAEGGLSLKHGGLGLGLAVVRQLIDLHGGSVAASSAGAGAGAAFTVRLPIDAELPRPAPDEDALLLADLHVRIDADAGVDPEPLIAILESSGAGVVVGGKDEPVDLTIGLDASTLRLRTAGRGDPDGAVQVVARSSPGAIVRGVARFCSPSRRPLRTRPGPFPTEGE